MYRRERHLASAITLTEIDYIFKYSENPAALRPHHKRLLDDISDSQVLPATSFLSWCVKNLNDLYNYDKADKELLRRAETVAHLAIHGSYTHFYKTPTSRMAKRHFPLDTLYSNLALTWSKVITSVAQSFTPRQEISSSYSFIFDAELCFIQVTTKTCFLVPYALILCFTDMCASWFSLDCYSAIHYMKYPGYNLQTEVRDCLARMMKLLADHKQKAYFLLKMWPPLVIGSILRDIELSSEFFTTITSDVSWILKQTQFYLAETQTILSPTHAMMKLEIAGLWKTMGHPVVDMNKSTASWMTKEAVMKRP